jgi:hypothetical protein
VLFGPGQDGTAIDDRAGDGVTNPRPITSFECDACNTHASTYPDDDGGYLRLFVGAYYRGGALSLTQFDEWKGAPTVNAGSTVTPLPAGTCQNTPSATIGHATITPNPVKPGQQVTISVYITLSCNTTASLVFDVYEGGLVKSILKVPASAQQFAGGQTRIIRVTGTLPTTAQAGQHIVTVGVFDVQYTTQYGFGAVDTSLQVS